MYSGGFGFPPKILDLHYFKLTRTKILNLLRDHRCSHIPQRHSGTDSVPVLMDALFLQIAKH